MFMFQGNLCPLSAMEETVLEFASTGDGRKNGSYAEVPVLLNDRSLIIFLVTALAGILFVMWFLRRCGLNTRGQMSILGVAMGGLVAIVIFALPPHQNWQKNGVSDNFGAVWMSNILLIRPELVHWVDSTCAYLSGGRLSVSAGRAAIIITIIFIMAGWILSALVSCAMAILNASFSSGTENRDLQGEGFSKVEATEHSFLDEDSLSGSDTHPASSESSMRGFLRRLSLSRSGLSKVRDLAEFSGDADWDGGGGGGGGDSAAQDMEEDDGVEGTGRRGAAVANVKRRMAAARTASASAAAEREAQRVVALEAKQRKQEEKRRMKESRNQQYEEAMQEVKDTHKAIRECKEQLRMEQIRLKRAELHLLDEGIIEMDSATHAAIQSEVAEQRKRTREVEDEREQLEVALVEAKGRLEAAKLLFKEGYSSLEGIVI